MNISARKPTVSIAYFGAYISMRNAVNVAARILCVCLSFFVLSGPPSPAQQQPQQQQPAQPTAEQPPSTQVPAQQNPSVVEQPYTGDGVSLTLFYWLTKAHPSMGTGTQNYNFTPSNLSTMGDNKSAPGFIASFPAGKHNSVRISYFRIQGDGNTTSPAAVNIYGTDFNQGDYLATRYTIQNAKISLDYLSWPFPLKDSKFRVKTLWEVQAIWIRSSVDAPLRTGEVDTSGNFVQTTGIGTNWFLYPSLGMGFDYLASKNFRIEGRASGFYLPGFSNIWDTEITANYRAGHFEVQAGGKAFHFKTSPRHVEYVRATFPGLYVGLRWYLEKQAR